MQSPQETVSTLTATVVVPEQLHQDVQVLGGDVSAAEPAGAVPAARQLLLPVPAGAAADPGHILADAHHHGHTADRGASPHSCQGRLRRLCECDAPILHPTYINDNISPHLILNSW